MAVSFSPALGVLTLRLLPHLFGLPLALTTHASVVATGYESLSNSASTASPGAVGLPRFLFRAAPIGLSSITYGLLLQTNVCVCIMPRFSEGFIFFSKAREDGGK